MNKKYLIQRGIHFFPQVCHLDIEYLFVLLQIIDVFHDLYIILSL